MKKIFSILLSLSIFFSSLSTVSAIELELPKSLEQFTKDVSILINEYDEVTSSDNPFFLLQTMNLRLRILMIQTD